MKSLSHLLCEHKFGGRVLEIKFRVVELKTPRFSTAIGANLYGDDRVERV